MIDTSPVCQVCHGRGYLPHHEQIDRITWVDSDIPCTNCDQYGNVPLRRGTKLLMNLISD